MVAHAPHGKHVRRVKGDSFQARPMLGSAHWNLGLYHPDDYRDDRGRPDRRSAIDAAERAAAEFTRRVFREELLAEDRPAPHALDLPPTQQQILSRVLIAWRVTQELQRTVRFGRPVVPPGVLPPWVKRADGGFVAVCRVREKRGGYLVSHRFTLRPLSGAAAFTSPVAAYLAMAGHLAARAVKRGGRRTTRTSAARP